MEYQGEEIVYETLERISLLLCRSDSKCFSILGNDQFDFLFSMAFSTQTISYKFRVQLIQILELGLKNLTIYMDKRKLLEFAENNMLTKNMEQQQQELIESGEFRTILFM